ncbi:NupC/NupG family nucleoside CNT transporter [Acetobacter sp. AN02]|uniref:NupC/NupG family nucleoside CNT transporter n=1 Tax=Acetobacter sp. AN02 TaxID=2894186 RepID=UPI0024341188|nr:nucleoside transporter C-terminal domain-containing protein [Acetobacter sp. AN02]MDG6094625.1 NupC/NupG family nucleoside CNT transporter [Acetobacter sp. AN02]
MTFHPRPLTGILVLILIAVLCSENRRAIRLRVTAPALLCQILAGMLMLGSAAGRSALAAAAHGMTWILSFGHAGIDFVFGALAGPDIARLIPSADFIFALHVLPQIIWLSALISVLYHFGLMQAVARLLGSALTRLLGITPLEGFSAVMAMFLGQTEIPVAIRPYLPTLSRTELFCAMSSGTSSIAMSMLAAYAGLGIPMEYLLAASLMAMPGGILFAKILMPSDRAAQNTAQIIQHEETRTASLFDALATGATNGLGIAVSVATMLIAFISFIALVNALLGIAGTKAGLPGLTLSDLFGFFLRPLVWILGVPWNECRTLAGIIGTKLAVNEFVAYSDLAPLIRTHALSTQTLAIASFAVCGFANLSSVGVLIGAFGSQHPPARPEVARLGPRAVLSGTLSNLTAAAIAGLFIA